MTDILQKALVRPFYKEHAGFFFVLLFFAGGMMKAQEHIAIARFIADNDFATMVMLTLFTLYQLKVGLFTKSLLRQDAYRFLRNLALLPLSGQVRLVLVAQVGMNVLVLAYGLFVGRMMWDFDATNRLVILFTYLLVSILIQVWLVMRWVKHPVQEQKINRLSHFLNQQFHKPFMLWYPIQLMKQTPIMYGLSKLLSVALLVGCFNIYDAERYDWRFIGVGTILAVSANLMLIYKYYEFCARQLAFFKNFPFSMRLRLFDHISTAFLLMLPEMLVIIRRMPASLSYGVVLFIIVYIIVIFLFYLHWALLKGTIVEALSRACFYFTSVQVLLVLYGIPFYALIIILLAVIFYVQSRYYQLQEWQEGQQ